MDILSDAFNFCMQPIHNCNKTQKRTCKAQKWSAFYCIYSEENKTLNLIEAYFSTRCNRNVITKVGFGKGRLIRTDYTLFGTRTPKLVQIVSFISLITATFNRSNTIMKIDIHSTHSGFKFWGRSNLSRIEKQITAKASSLRPKI